MSNKGFEKFIKPDFKGAKKKEAIRQEKRKIKAELRAAGEEARRKKWEQQRGIQSDKPEDRRQNTENRWQKPDDRKFENRKSKIENREFTDKRNFKSEKRSQKTDDRKFENRDFKSQTSNQKSEDRRQNIVEKKFEPRNIKSEIRDQQSGNRNFKPQPPNQKPAAGNKQEETELMPLNKFIAYCGICGRREAAEIIKNGLVTVNGDTIFEPGFKVRGNEDVKVKGKKIFLQRNLTYVLLNKPKDYITTAKDPEGRKTVLDLIKGATKERIYPVGRLDRNTTGVLLLTNDGELAQKLTHPSFEIKKIYEVRLDKPVTKKDMEAIVTGIQLEDGFIKADSIAYADTKDKSIIGIEIHSGKNRIVRRIFEHLGYDVRNLDRVMFANLTKKNVDRGKWRFLNEKEVRLLKFLNQSFVKKH